MNEKTFNETIIDDIEQIENQSDLTEAIMSRIESKQVTIKKTVRHSGIFMFLILMLLTSTAYAAVKVISIIDLKNENNDIVASVELIDSDDNHHLDSHVNMKDLFRFGDKLRSAPEWKDKAFIVVDSQGEYPYNVDVRCKADQFYEYRDIEYLSEIKDIFLLPKHIQDYEFNNAYISYLSEFPSEEFVEEMLKYNAKERFLVSEVGVDSIRSIGYTYKGQENNQSMSVQFMQESENDFLSLNSNLISDYEVVMLDHIEAILVNKKYLGVSYQANDTIKLLGENYYVIMWYDNEKEISVCIEPRMWTKELKEEIIDGVKVRTETYPIELKDYLIDFSRNLQKEMN